MRGEDQAAAGSRRQCECTVEDGVLGVDGGRTISGVDCGHAVIAGSGRQGFKREAAVVPGESVFPGLYAGNTEILAPLKAAGANLEEPMILIGTSSTTPLMGAVRFGNLDVAKTLVDLGASVNQTDGSGITPIGRAVLGNQVEMARFLIARGAEVNHTDKLGMTPLLYAASIDFGDSAIIDLLLKVGANREARTKEGLTALDLARKYNSVHLLPSLNE